MNKSCTQVVQVISHMQWKKVLSQQQQKKNNIKMRWTVLFFFFWMDTQTKIKYLSCYWLKWMFFSGLWKVYPKSTTTTKLMHMNTERNVKVDKRTSASSTKMNWIFRTQFSFLTFYLVVTWNHLCHCIDCLFYVHLPPTNERKKNPNRIHVYRILTNIPK